MGKLLVVAPNLQVYEFWLQRFNRDATASSYVADFQQLAEHWEPILVLNGGSPDAYIQNLVNHPAYAGLRTYLTV